ncbi:MFS transporter [Candidatus Woesearchaeota archaeon]|nr:MFS transporter [Candidatus Woesearchaeota archaeon]
MHKQNRLFLIMFSFFGLAESMFGPIYAIYIKGIGGDILEAGIAWSIFMLVSGIGIFIMGKIQDHKSDKKFILFGYSFVSLGFLGYYFISNIGQLFLVQVVLGIGTMILVPARDSFYTKYLEKGKFASQWAAWESLWYVIAGIAALIGAFIANRFGFQFLFIVMFVLSMIGLVIGTQLKENER